MNGTEDHRSLAGFITGLAIVVVAVIIITIETTPIQPSTAYLLTSIFSSLIIFYVRPCKSTIANLSLGYHSMVIGILCFAFRWWKYYSSIQTGTLEKIFIIIPATSHILVFMWAGYTVTRRIMSHFGYQLNPHDCQVALTDLVNAVKQQFNRRRSSYQVLPDTT